MHAYRLVAAPLALFMSATVFACVGDDAPATTPADASVTDSGSTDAGSPTDSGATDAGPPPDASSDAGPTCAAPTVACAATCANLKTDAANCGRCGHSCLGGACTSGVCSVVPLTPSQDTTTRIRTDADTIYWLRQGNALIEAGIFALKKDAPANTAPTVVVKEAIDGTRYRGLALSDASIYFHIGGTTSRVKGLASRPKAGGGSAVLLSTIMQLSDIAATADGSSVAYAIPTPYNQDPNGSIHVVNVATKSDTLVSTTVEANPVSLAYDSQNLYWLNAGTYKSDVAQKNGGLFRGTSSANRVKIAGAPTETDLGDLAVAGATAFWTSTVLQGQPSLRTTSTNPGSSSGAFLGSAGKPSVVATDGTNVFWSENGVLLMCPVSGCPTTATRVLASTGKDFTALEVDNNAIYFAKEDGYIYKLAKP